ncbi:MAG: TIGR02444 family protein [Pseudomonadota bacterium]
MRLWDYAVQVYGIEGVQERLLAWQDRHGGDVNIALWCLWCGRKGLTVAADDVPVILLSADAITSGAVRPLRGARRYLTAPKPDQDSEAFAALRKEVLALELKAEELVLNQLDADTRQRTAEAKDPPPMEEIASQLFTLALKQMDMAAPKSDEDDPESPMRLFESILMLAKDHGP